MLLKEGRKRFLEYLKSIDRSSETIRGYEMDLEFFDRYLAQKYNCFIYLEDVTSTDIEDYLLWLKEKKNYAPASRSRHLNTLRSFFSWASRKELVERNITLNVEAIKLRKKERTYLSEEEVEELVEVIAHPMISIVVRTLYFTGLRISECLNLTLDTVDLEKRIIRVIAGKGNKDRNIPIAGRLLPILKDYLKTIRPETSSPLFFATGKTGKLSAVYVNAELAAAVERLGWSKKVTAHILRHSFASQLVQKDVNLVQIQKLLGHSSLAVTSIYTHANMGQLQDAVNCL